MIYKEITLTNYILMLILALTIVCSTTRTNEPEVIIIRDTTYETVYETEYHTQIIENECPKIEEVKPQEPAQPVSKIDEDTYLLAKIINAEAGVEPYKGKIAVGNVVLNRVASDEFPDTIKEVIYQKGQFSPISDGSINKEPNEDSIKAAKEVLAGSRVVGKDVLYFYDPRISTSEWIFTRKVVTKIGDHAFAI